MLRNWIHVDLQQFRRQWIHLCVWILYSNCTLSEAILFLKNIWCDQLIYQDDSANDLWHQILHLHTVDSNHWVRQWVLHIIITKWSKPTICREFHWRYNIHIQDDPRRLWHILVWQCQRVGSICNFHPSNSVHHDHIVELIDCHNGRHICLGQRRRTTIQNERIPTTYPR